jgi:hypothetical protein
VFAPASASKVTFNGQNLSVKKSAYGTLLASKAVSLPAVTLPELQSITWVCPPFGLHLAAIAYNPTESGGLAPGDLVAVLGRGLAGREQDEHLQPNET